MYSFVFATKSVVLAAVQFSQLASSKAYAAKLAAQYCAHVIAYGCTQAEYDLVSSIMANKTDDTDMAQFKAKAKPAYVAPVATKAGSCGKCMGSGTYQWGWDGKGFRYSGVCFDCKGKSVMDKADVVRDTYYHNHIEKLDFAH
jgi:hypothetical protein